MGEGGVDLAAALRRAPELPLGPRELGAHGLELPAEPPELVVARRPDAEVEVVGGDAPRRVVHGRDGAREPAAVEAPPRYDEAGDEYRGHELPFPRVVHVRAGVRVRVHGQQGVGEKPQEPGDDERERERGEQRDGGVEREGGAHRAVCRARPQTPQRPAHARHEYPTPHTVASGFVAQPASASARRTRRTCSVTTEESPGSPQTRS